MTSSLVCDSAEMEELLFPILEILEKKDFDLPPLPQIANQVLALTTDPEANSSQLTKLITKDPVLTAKMLKTANSAGCGASRQIERVEQAVAWLGLNSVAGSAFALSFQSFDDFCINPKYICIAANFSLEKQIFSIWGDFRNQLCPSLVDFFPKFYRVRPSAILLSETCIEFTLLGFPFKKVFIEQEV